MDKCQLLYFGFNQELNCVAVGLKTGLKVLECSTFKTLYSYTGGAISIVEMVYNADMLIVVGADDKDQFSPKKVTLWSTEQNAVIIDKDFFQRIEAVRLNRSRLIACSKEKIHIFGLSNMRFLCTLDVQFALTRFALSPGSDLFVFSDSVTTGTVSVYDTDALHFMGKISAHKSPVLKLTLNYLGSMIATVDTEGTFVYVFSLPRGHKLYTFKRGFQKAHVFSLSFNLNSTHLALSGSSGTIHIFKLEDQPPLSESLETRALEKPKSSSWLGGLFKSVASLIVSEDSIDSSKSVMTLKHPAFSQRNISVISEEDNSVFIITCEGKYYVWDIDFDSSSSSPSLRAEYNL